jgi:hypothetical protein
VNLIKRHKILSAIVAAVVVIIIAVVAAGGSGGGGSTAPAQPKAPAVQPHNPAPAKPKPNERADLNYLNLEDKSQAGLTDIWVKWSVTNHSSKASDYWISWEAVNSQGVRVADGSELTNNVQPGQTARQDTPTTLTTSHVKIVVTKFDRTEAYG